MMRPAGVGATLFITSTTASLKLGSGSSARAARRIAVNGFASSADAGHDIPNTSSNAQKVRVTGRTRVIGRLQMGRRESADGFDAAPDRRIKVGLRARLDGEIRNLENHEPTSP